jgi:pilus assembly protein CpaB
MNPRQRRGALLIGAAALGALVVFFTVLSYVGDVSAQVGNTRTAIELSRPVAAFEPVTEDMVREVEVPARWLPDAALGSVAEISNLVAAADLPEGALLQRGMVRDRPGIQTGNREIAILVDARTGVAGKVRPGDRVDLIATMQAEDQPPRAELIVSDALLIDVGVTRATRDNDQNSDDFGEPQQLVPVTFALSVEDALKVSYAESFATELRLALRGGGDDSVVPESERVFEGSFSGPSPEEGEGRQ